MNKWVKLAAALLCALLWLTGCGGETTSVNETEAPAETTVLDLSGTQQPDLEQIMQMQSLEKLDLRDTQITVEDYEMLRDALPNCEIQWSVPFQGGYLDCATQTVTVTALTDEDIEMLTYLPQLQSVDASGCSDYEQLGKLQESRPDCCVEYTVTIQETEYPSDTAELTFENVSVEELNLIRSALPKVMKVTLTQLQEDPTWLLDWMEKNPEIDLCWDTKYLGVTVNSQATFLDFSNITVRDLEALEAFVTRLPKLEQVDMLHCRVSNEDMDALNRRHEDIKFVWAVYIDHASVRTDVKHFMPYQYHIYLRYSDTWKLKYLTECECVDLGHHGAADCEFVKYMPNLRYLLLGDTKVSDISPLEGNDKIIYLELLITDVTDYSPLLTMPNLESLNLCFTKGDAEIISQLTWVDYIRWISAFEDRFPSQEEQEYLREKLPNTLLEFGVNESSTGGMWRQHQNYFDMRDLLGMHYMEG